MIYFITDNLFCSLRLFNWWLGWLEILLTWINYLIGIIYGMVMWLNDHVDCWIKWLNGQVNGVIGWLEIRWLVGTCDGMSWKVMEDGHVMVSWMTCEAMRKGDVVLDDDWMESWWGFGIYSSHLLSLLINNLFPQIPPVCFSFNFSPLTLHLLSGSSPLRFLTPLSNT